MPPLGCELAQWLSSSSRKKKKKKKKQTQSWASGTLALAWILELGVVSTQVPARVSSLKENQTSVTHRCLVNQGRGLEQNAVSSEPIYKMFFPVR